MEVLDGRAVAAACRARADVAMIDDDEQQARTR
jgi:hypothetical protein